MALVTKSGRWIEREADKHKCDKPTPGDSHNVTTGDIWQCNTCKQNWQVTVNNDQREGKWFTWKPYAPTIGTTDWRDR